MQRLGWADRRRVRTLTLMALVLAAATSLAALQPGGAGAAAGGWSDEGNQLLFTDEAYNQLFKFIAEDEYLSTHRGRVAERNGARTPWIHQLDLRVAQFLPLTGSHRLEVTAARDVVEPDGAKRCDRPVGCHSHQITCPSRE